MKVKQFADILGYTPRRIRQLIEKGDISARLIPGRGGTSGSCYEISDDRLDDIIAKCNIIDRSTTTTYSEIAKATGLSTYRVKKIVGSGQSGRRIPLSCLPERIRNRILWLRSQEMVTIQYKGLKTNAEWITNNKHIFCIFFMTREYQSQAFHKAIQNRKSVKTEIMLTKAEEQKIKKAADIHNVTVSEVISVAIEHLKKITEEG